MRWNLHLFLDCRRMRNRIHIDFSGNITYNDYTVTDLLLKNLYWAGRKTRVHQMAGKTPAVFIMRKNKLVSIFDKHRI